MPHSKPHATLFSSDELVEPSKIGNHAVSDKRIKSTLIMLYIHIHKERERERQRGRERERSRESSLERQ